jgi:hypothetical protein
VIACMVVQSSPLGQHSTVVFEAKGIQVELCGQQKLDDRPASVHSENPVVAHVEALPKRLCADIAEAEASRPIAMSTKHVDTRDRPIFPNVAPNPHELTFKPSRNSRKLGGKFFKK